MLSRSTLRAGVCLAALTLASAAHADVTAEQVWQDWKDYYASLGQTVTAASEARDGDTLVVTGVSMVQDQNGTRSEATIAEVKLREMGDGTVEVTLSNDIPVKVTAAPADGPPAEISMNLSHQDLRLLASGVPENMVFDFTASELRMVMDEMMVDETAPPFRMEFVATGNTGRHNSVKDAGRTVTSEFAADKISVVMTGADPETSGTFTMNGDMNGLTGAGTVVVPEGVDMQDVNAAVQAGFAVDGKFNYADGKFTMEGAGPDGSFKADSSGGAGNLAVRFGKDGLAYGGEAVDSRFSVTTPQLPFPVEMELAQSAFNAVMPLSKSETAQPAALLIKMVDLKVSDELWNMVDPGQQLPRDPATLVFDVTGALKPLIDLLDPEAAAAFEGGMAEGAAPAAPFEVSEAKINQLQVKAVGAELTGTGAMTFDNSAGMPMPLGSIDLSLTGANALMDKLTAMGLIPADQVMGFKMMLGMFAVPAGEDALTSKIEFKEGGSIFANGQQIQ
jgi:hypothetical protein